MKKLSFLFVGLLSLLTLTSCSSDDDETECFIQDNYYYLCAAEEDPAGQILDQYEAEEDYTLEFVDPQTAIAKNRSVRETTYPLMLEREARVLELLIEEGLL